MSLYSLFSKVKQQMGFQQNDSVPDENFNTDNTSNCATEDQNSEDDDDYLLVTASAKKAKTEAVSHSEVILSQSHLPNGNCVKVSDSSECQRNELLFHNPSSGVLDIPFTLHEQLHTHLQARGMFKDVSLEPRAFNYLKYSHDFTNEKLCLRDMNSNEKANIDEFLLPPSDSQSGTHIPSRNDEVNLMQF